MREYTVRHSQNIYDIALTLYGSIEGIFDLLTNNDGINMNDEIPVGTVLEYDETFTVNSQIIDWIDENSVVVANGNPSFDASAIPLDNMRFIVDQKGASSVMVVTLSSGSMYIDWGDGSEIDVVKDTSEHEFDHPYTEDGRHVIRVFGNFALRNLDLTEIGGPYYALSSCRVSGTFRESTNRTDLKTLFK